MTDAERFGEEYLKKLFYFSLKKTGNESDADDLTEDIAEAVLSALNRGAEPENFDAWVWTVARNRWNRYARRRYYGPDYRKRKRGCAKQPLLGL